ncbi:MAG: RHS repeat domain-containing protein, partial [Acutalibacteraceae bacterium]
VEENGLYIWDDENGTETEVENKYNALGLRTYKRTGDDVLHYLLENGESILEVNASGEEIARNVYGINLISRESGNQTVNYLYNGHGDVTSLIDQSGEILASYYYDVYGKITEQTGNFDNSITFSGYTLDSETGLYYLNARMYNPDDARFLQEDTYKGNPTDILSLNIYTYCVGNPLKYIDPTGHTAINSTAAITSGTVCSGSTLTGEAVNNGAICSGSALTGEAVNNGAICSGFAFMGDAINCESFVVESFNEYFANRKLTVCAVFDWMTKLWGELVSQTPQEVLQDLRNSFALPDNLKSSFADTLAYLNDIKEEVAVVATATVLIAGGVMMMHCSPSVGTGLVNAGLTVASKAFFEFVQNGKVTGSFSDYVKTGAAGFAAGSISSAITNFGAAAGVTGLGKSLLAAAEDMAVEAATQYILTGKVDPKEVVVSGLFSFVCAEGFRQAPRITSNLKSTKALKSYSSTQKVVSVSDDFVDNVARATSNRKTTEIILPSKPHTNKTPGHWETILDEVERMKNSGQYSKIYVNKGLRNEVPSVPINRRPDIMAVRWDGIIDQVEVPSKSDQELKLIKRMIDNNSMLGKRAGEIEIVHIDKIVRNIL